jgi:hypothetical protein
MSKSALVNGSLLYLFTISDVQDVSGDLELFTWYRDEAEEFFSCSEPGVISEPIRPLSSFASTLVKLNNSSKWIIWMSFCEQSEDLSSLSCTSDEPWFV